MSSTSPRRPSTLAAAKYSAAARLIGATPDPRALARPTQPPMTGTVRQPTSAQRATTAPPRPTAGERKGASTTASKQDGQIVTSLIVTFVLLVCAVASVRISGNAKVERSKTAMTGTLENVHVRQSTFHLLNRRFATWSELEARGVKLPGKQSVVSSNATMSHWFVAVRDGSTGVVCEKTGELFDEGPDDRKPTCRDPID